MIENDSNNDLIIKRMIMIMIIIIMIMITIMKMKMIMIMIVIVIMIMIMVPLRRLIYKKMQRHPPPTYPLLLKLYASL